MHILKVNRYLRQSLKVVGTPLLLGVLTPGITSASLPNVKATIELNSFNQVIIKGKVTDSTGEPLPGVSVKVKGTAVGTSTDLNGNFMLNTSGENTLVFTFIGFKIQEIQPGNRTILNVVMQDDAVSLDDVVVIGYGTMKKRDLTGSVVSVKSSDITLTPTPNVMDALQGKVAGMEIVKSSGRAGAGVDITVRGTRSIYGDNTPLFIIDGIAGSYESLNPSDIESIDILKDASSTAIYGSAGSNGVVIITTRQGKAGKVTVNFDSFFGYNGFARYPHGLTGEAYTGLKREAYRGQHGSYPEFMNNIFTNPDHLAAYDAGKWIDWVDLISKNGTEQNYSVSLNGGTENTKAYVSLNYNNEEGLLENDNNKKYAVRGNIDHTISKVLKTGTNLQFTYTDRNERAQNVFGNALTFLPLGDPFNTDGSINHVPINGVTNPMSDEIPDQYENNLLNQYFAGNAFLEVTPLKGLSFRTILGTTLGSSRLGKYFGRQSIANPEAGFSLPAAVVTNERDYNYRWENILNYAFNLGKDHFFSLTGVTSWAKNQWEQTYAGGSGFDLDSYSFYNLDAASKATIRSNYIRNQSMSYVGRINYNYKGKYLLTLSNRWDGVSRLSEGNKWDSFPAGALAWRISDENFFKSVQEHISNLKLRIGYGVTGNSGGVGAYGTIAGGFNAPKPVGFGVNTEGPSFILNQELANTALGWEKSYNTNIGLDAELLKGAVSLALDWYNTDTKDLLYKRSMPASLGGSWGSPFKMWQNIGETNNRGFEIMLNTRNIQKKDFTWNSVITFTRNKEKIVSLPGNKDLIADNLFLNSPVKTFYNYKYLGIWQENEAAEAANYNSVPGDIKIATNGVFDANGKHTYSANDKVILGTAVPDWTGGIQNSVSFRQFDANIFVMARWGQMLASDLITRYDPTLGTSNSPEGIDYWTPENPSAYLPRPGLHDKTSGYFGWDALKFVDGSYVKIRNITLGYTLNKNVLDKLSMQKLRVYVTANNPFIFAKSSLLKDQDPERGGSDNFPLTKQFVFGLNVTF